MKYMIYFMEFIDLVICDYIIIRIYLIIYRLIKDFQDIEDFFNLILGYNYSSFNFEYKKYLPKEEF